MVCKRSPAQSVTALLVRYGVTFSESTVHRPQPEARFLHLRSGRSRSIAKYQWSQSPHGHEARWTTVSQEVTLYHQSPPSHAEIGITSRILEVEGKKIAS